MFVFSPPLAFRKLTLCRVLQGGDAAGGEQEGLRGGKAFLTIHFLLCELLFPHAASLPQWIATINNISKRIYLSENAEVSAFASLWTSFSDPSEWSRFPDCYGRASLFCVRCSLKERADMMGRGPCCWHRPPGAARRCKGGVLWVLKGDLNMKL